MRGVLTLLVLAGLVYGLYLASTVEVPPGHLGVREIERDWFGMLTPGVVKRPLIPGRHWVMPFSSSVSVYPATSEMLNLDVPIDGQEEPLSVTARVRIKKESVLDIHDHYGADYFKNICGPTLSALIVKAVRESRAREDIADWDDFLQIYAAPKLERDGFILERLILKSPPQSKTPKPASKPESGGRA